MLSTQRTMPYGKRYKRRGRGRKTRKKTVGKKLLRDARKRGTNSALEKAVQIISRREAKKLIAPNLIFRRTIWGSYNRNTNTFGVGTAIDMDGLIVHMAQIPLYDTETVGVVTPAADGALVPNIPVYNRGPNDLAPMKAQDGYRSNTVIFLKNLGCDLRFYLDPTGVAAQPREDVTVWYRIVSVTDPDQHQLTWKPDIEEVLPYKGLGYSSRLDTGIRDATNDMKFTTLKKGKIRLRYHDYRPQERFKSLYWGGSKRYEYLPTVTGISVADQNGQRVTGTSKVFLVLRSDIPTALAAGFKIRVNGFLKVGYRNLM